MRLFIAKLNFAFPAMTLYHDGSDGGQFEFVEIVDSLSDVYRCYFERFLDGLSFETDSGCFKM